MTCDIKSHLTRLNIERQSKLIMFEITKNIEKSIIVGDKKIVPWKDFKKTEIIRTGPTNFEVEKTTVWSFPSRGDWASHTPQYRGNWAPEIIRNVLELYSQPGDTILDPMVGGGTTPVECLLTGRNSISVDINPDAIYITRDRLNLPESITKNVPNTTHRTYVGDTRHLDKIDNESIDLIAAHPPYANMIKYTKNIEGDLSRFNDYLTFFAEYRKAIQEYYRVLKKGGYCAVLIGDTHNHSHFVPISTRLMFDFLREGFFLKEDIIKKEWNCKSDRDLKKYSNSNFLFTMHEHLFIFKKPKEGEYLKNSSIDFMIN